MNPFEAHSGVYCTKGSSFSLFESVGLTANRKFDIYYFLSIVSTFPVEFLWIWILSWKFLGYFEPFYEILVILNVKCDFFTGLES